MMNAKFEICFIMLYVAVFCFDILGTAFACLILPYLIMFEKVSTCVVLFSLVSYSVHKSFFVLFVDKLLAPSTNFKTFRYLAVFSGPNRDSGRTLPPTNLLK